MFTNFDWLGAMRSSPVMVIILLCSVVTLGFALERALYFWRRRGRPDAFFRAATEKVRTGRIQEAVFECMATPHPVGPIAAEVLRNAHMSPNAVEEKMHIALSEQRLQLERNLGVLGTMGNTAPLIGLLGTVWGIMRAFHDMASTGSAGPSVVAAGVAEALFTTAAALVVAVPSVMLYNQFVRRIAVMLTQAENLARSLRLELEAAPVAQVTAQAERRSA
ncbi:MAG TPA: MotA/TolQ/ExbB proton channel family protein [Methylomirabilota bacterium]|jgi:biopolymer transport protein ExbB|nr:MotA/TolQ/ExbB proton channel family protein [Methylomirabilota bacterium]